MPVPLLPCRSADLQALQDEICMHSAATGSLIGFDGRVLQVRRSGYLCDVPLDLKPCTGRAELLKRLIDAVRIASAVSLRPA